MEFDQKDLVLSEIQTLTTSQLQEQEFAEEIKSLSFKILT